MNQFLRVELAQFAELSKLLGLPPIDPQLLNQHAPDAHWVLVQADRLTAHCSLWWKQTPSYLHHQVGLIGHYAAEEGAAQLLLNHAADRLAEQGCTMAIAPIDGNTWRPYRLISDGQSPVRDHRGSEPLFFLEPDNPNAWCSHFEAAGFRAIAHYSSALATDLTQQDPRMQRVAERLDLLQVTVRSIDLQQFEEELEAIYNLSRISFRQNFLYTPIDWSEFVAQYSQIRDYVQPEFVLMAEQDGRLVGFLFAVPDLMQARRGQSIDTIVIKTVAVLPERAYAGLGNWLVARVQTIAHQLGYTRAVHALMHDDNRSRNLSSRYAHPIRRYALFGRTLGTL